MRSPCRWSIRRDTLQTPHHSSYRLCDGGGVSSFAKAVENIQAFLKGVPVRVLS